MADENEDQGQGGAAASDANANNQGADDGSLLDLASKGEGGDAGGSADGGDKGGQVDKQAQGDPTKAASPAQRPDYLPEKFWDADKGQPRLDALFKSYSELETKLRTGTHKAPAKVEDYKIAASDEVKALGLGEIDTKHPLFSGMLSELHAEGLSNDAVNKIVNRAIKIAADVGGKPVDPKAAAQAEFQKLGKGAQTMIDGLNGWGSYLKTEGILSEDEFKEFRFMAGTAEGVRVLLKLRELSGEKSIPTNTVSQAGLPSKDELYKKTADPRYGTDQAFTRQVDAEFEKVFGTDPAGAGPGMLGR